MYQNVSYQYRRFLFLAIKLSIVTGCIYFIYQKVIENKQLAFNDFIAIINQYIVSKPIVIITLFGLTALNWLLEILKWKTLVSVIKNISFFEASKQSLGSMTTALLTPNRIGEYGAKALYYKKGKKKVIFLNFFGNLAQLLATVFFGSIGLYYFITHFKVEVSMIGIRRAIYMLTVFGFFIFFGARVGKRKFGGYYLDKAKVFVSTFSNLVIWKTILFAFARYTVFSFQFYFLLTTFGYHEAYLQLFTLISAMYFISSVIPSFTIFDWAIKGSIALWVFSFISVNDLHIFTITLIMWLLNFALPSLIGSYFVLTYKKAMI